MRTLTGQGWLLSVRWPVMIERFRSLTNNRVQLITAFLISIGALILLGLGPALVITVLQAIVFSVMVLAMLLVLPSLKEEWEYMGSIDWFRKELKLVSEEPATTDAPPDEGAAPDNSKE